MSRGVWSRTGIGLLATTILWTGVASTGDQPEEEPVRVEDLDINADEMRDGTGVHAAADGQHPSDSDSSYAARFAAILNRERLELGRILDLIAEADDPMERLALERQLAERKELTEVELQQLQLERARGRAPDAVIMELERQIEAHLEAITRSSTSREGGE